MISILHFLNIVTEDGQLNLVNLAVYIILFKLAFAPVVNLIDLGTLLVTLLAKAHETHLNSK